VTVDYFEMVRRSASVLLALAAIPGAQAFLDTLEAQYAFSGFATGADSIAGLTWTTYFFALAEADQLCGTTPGGVSSGADGEPCSTFNETAFLAAGGAACISPDSVTPNYLHDDALPGCTAALASYRASDPTYTCDCDGDYAFLGGTGGIRSDVIWTTINSLTFAFICLLGPLLGTVIDYQGGKGWWSVLSYTAAGGLAGMAVIGSDFVWAVGLAFSFVATVASELVTVPRQAYLDEIQPSSSSETLMQATARVSGRRMVMSYLSQLIFVIVTLGLVFALPTAFQEAGGVAIIVCILAAFWYSGFLTVVLCKIKTRLPTREREGKGLCAAAFGPLIGDFKRLLANHPEAAKYLLFLTLAQNGLGSTILAVANPYLLEGPPKAVPLQVQAVFAVTLLFGMPWTCVYMKLTRKLSYRVLLLLVMAFNVIAILLIGFAFIRPFGDSLMSASFIGILLVAAFLVAPGLTWWYSIYWPAFMALVPEAQVNQYSGIFTFVRTFALIWHSGPIYFACVNSLASAGAGHRLGVLTMLAWDLLALPVLFWIDFDKGKRECGRDKAQKETEYATEAVVPTSAA